MTQVADRVRSLRVALGLSQEALALRGGLLRVQISKIEGGHNQASTFEMRARLARAFGLTFDDVVELLDGTTTSVDALKARCVEPQLQAG